jgi:hypothetical protein
MMMTFEETKVLQYLGRRFSATMADVGQTCLSGAPPEWVGRVVANLDWLGYVTVFPGGGHDSTLRITQKGLAQFRGRQHV